MVSKTGRSKRKLCKKAKAAIAYNLLFREFCPKCGHRTRLQGIMIVPETGESKIVKIKCERCGHEY